MAMQSWKSFLMPYEQAVEELKVKLKSIRKEYRKRNEYSPIEFVTGRVKEVSSLLEKAKGPNLRNGDQTVINEVFKDKIEEVNLF